MASYRQKVIAIKPSAELRYYAVGYNENKGFGSGVDGYSIIIDNKRIGNGFTPYQAWKTAYDNLKR